VYTYILLTIRTPAALSPSPPAAVVLASCYMWYVPPKRERKEEATKGERERERERERAEGGKEMNIAFLAML
jgi:hypothetical protein